MSRRAKKPKPYVIVNVDWHNGAPEELARKLDRMATHQLINAALIAGVVLTLLLLTFGCSQQESPELLTCQRELEGTKWELQRAEQKLTEQTEELFQIEARMDTFLGEMSTESLLGHRRWKDSVQEVVDCRKKILECQKNVKECRDGVSDWRPKE